MKHIFHIWRVVTGPSWSIRQLCLRRHVSPPAPAPALGAPPKQTLRPDIANLYASTGGTHTANRRRVMTPVLWSVTVTDVLWLGAVVHGSSIVWLQSFVVEFYIMISRYAAPFLFVCWAASSPVVRWMDGPGRARSYTRHINISRQRRKCPTPAWWAPLSRRWRRRWRKLTTVAMVTASVASARRKPPRRRSRTYWTKRMSDL